jgi:hypothetical protein
MWLGANKLVLNIIHRYYSNEDCRGIIYTIFYIMWIMILNYITLFLLKHLI